MGGKNLENTEKLSMGSNQLDNTLALLFDLRLRKQEVSIF